jgi:hypothetical protein
MATKKMQVGGAISTAKKVGKAVVKNSPEYKVYKAAGKGAKKIDDALEKRYPNYTGKGSVYSGVKQGVKTVLGYKKGGVIKSAEPTTAAKKATGKVGGISKAPKMAMPKKQLGGSVSEKRADKMVAKGKAVNTYSYPSMERSVTKVKKSGKGDAFVSSKDLGKTKKVKG